MIDIFRATEIANEYKQIGHVGILEMTDLLSFILWSEDSDSISIATIAFSDENIDEYVSLF